MAAVILWGVVGFVSMGWSWFDALFMVVITISGVGYGEVLPLNEPLLRIHTMLVIALGALAVGYTLAGFIQFFTEGEIQRLLGHQRMRRHIETLRNHIIVAGFGRVGGLVCDELAESGLEFVVIELANDRVAELARRDILYIQGDATDEDVLRTAGVDHAKVLVSVMPSDADNVFIMLTARQLAPKLTIISRSELHSTSKKLRQAGANHIVSPAVIGAHRIVSLLTNPSVVEFAELVTHKISLAIEMDEFPVSEGDGLHGRGIREADVSRRTGVIIVALKRRDGRVEFPAPIDAKLEVGDTVVLLGRRENLVAFQREFTHGDPT